MWEYLRVQISISNGLYKAKYSSTLTVSGFNSLEEVLNYFGKDKWELVTIQMGNYIFKRIKEN